MASRLPAIAMAVLALGAGLAGCTADQSLPGQVSVPFESAGGAAPSPQATAAAAAQAGTPEAKLSLQALGMQRTALEGALLGMGIGAGVNQVRATPIPMGMAVGFTGGLVGGNYVGFLKSQFATNELRLEQLRKDIDATNAETEAVIRTMREVLARQEAGLAAARAASGGAQTPQVVAQEQAAASSLADMQAAIAGASNRAVEFNDVRALALAPGERTGADAQVNDLSARISEMRQIAASLAADV